MSGPQQVPADAEQVLDHAVDDREALQLAGGLEASHLAFPMACRLMRDLRPIVLILPRAVHDGRHRGTVGSGVAPELVGDQPTGLPTLAFQQLPEEALRGPTIRPRLHEDVDHVAVFIHGSPQVVQPPADLDEHFVQMPGVAHPVSPASQAPRILAPERQTPLADRLIRDGDTAFREEILDLSETQANAVVDPDGVTDDVSGKAVSAIAGRRARHLPTLSPGALT